LNEDDEEDEIFGQWLWPAEFGYLSHHIVSYESIEEGNGREKGPDFRMSFNNSHSPRPMRLLRICPEEIMFLDFERWGCLGLWRAS
jgi:hypothetical protein